MNDSEQTSSKLSPCDVEEVDPVGSLGSEVANGRLVPRVPIYYDRLFIFAFTNASLLSLAPPENPALGLPSAFSVPQCSHITWRSNCISGEETVPLILMVVPIDSPTRYFSNSRCADGAYWDADLPVGQRVLFGFFDAHGHFGGLTRYPYLITSPTSALSNGNEPIPQTNSTSGLSNHTRSSCRMATELPTPIELVLYPPSNPCNYLLLQIKGGHGPYTLTVLNPDKATWADITVDTTSTVLLTNISDPGSTIVMFAVDKNLVGSQVTGEYKLGHPGTCNSTMDDIIAKSLYDSSLVATRRNLHLRLIVPTAVLGFICLILFILAIGRRTLLAQRVGRWRGFLRSSSASDEGAPTSSGTIIKPVGPSSSSLPSQCTPVYSQSDIRLSSVEISKHHGHEHINEHGVCSTVVALARVSDPRLTMLDELTRPPHVVSKSRHSDTSTRNYNAGDSSVELMQVASPGTRSEGGGFDSSDMGTSLGHTHRSSVPKLLIRTDSAFMLEKVRSGSDKEETPTTIGLADPNEFLYRNAGWNLSTNRNTSTGQAAAAPGLAALAPVLPIIPPTPSPPPAVQLPPSLRRNFTTPPAMQSPRFDRGTCFVPITSIRE